MNLRYLIGFERIHGYVRVACITAMLCHGNLEACLGDGATDGRPLAEDTALLLSDLASREKTDGRQYVTRDDRGAITAVILPQPLVSDRHVRALGGISSLAQLSIRSPNEAVVLTPGSFERVEPALLHTS